MRLQDFFRIIARKALRFRSNQTGSVAVTFTITCLPLLAAIGCAVDYARAVNIRTLMLNAADTASVGSVSEKSPGYIAAQSMTANGEVTAGSTNAKNIFNGRISTVSDYNNLTLSAVVTKTGLQVTSAVEFSAFVPTTFMKVLGFDTIKISNISQAAAQLPGYLDFYLMLDVSGSMGLPSTDSEQSRLAAINPDNYSLYPNGCTFACHFSSANACNNAQQKYNTNGYCLGYSLSRTAGNSSNTPVTACSTPGSNACIQLRADAVGYAVQQLLQTANTSARVANQYRIGLYPYIQRLYAYFPLTSSISGSSTNSTTINYAAANLATLLDTGVNTSLGSGGTHFENAFPTMSSLITSVGDGSTWNNTLPYVFLITDGAQNNQVQWGGGWSGDNHATVIDTSLCTPLKNRGIKISVLYIPYQTIQNPTSFGNNEDYAVNAIIPYIPPKLEACASPGFFFTANTPADITSALNAMFNQAVQTARITK